MTEVQQLLRNYGDVRSRLRSPVNAVPDLGIDLKRKPFRPVVIVEPMPEAPEPYTYRGFPMAADGQIDVTVETPPSEEVVHLVVHKVEDIKRAACRHFGVSKIDIISARRPASLVTSRFVAMYLTRVLTTKSFPEIGRHYGGRDHTSILHACQRIEQRRITDPELNEHVLAVARSLGVETI